MGKTRPEYLIGEKQDMYNVICHYYSTNISSQSLYAVSYEK
jgi:hypothetical protein